LAASRIHRLASGGGAHGGFAILEFVGSPPPVGGGSHGHAAQLERLSGLASRRARNSLADAAQLEWLSGLASRRARNSLADAAQLELPWPRCSRM
jgi:hypothetical protein